MGQEVLDAYSLVGAGALALHTPDAAGLTLLHGDGTAVEIITRYPHYILIRMSVMQLDYTSRTALHTLAAPRTTLEVYCRQCIARMDGQSVKHASQGAVTAGQTSVYAVRFTLIGSGLDGTGAGSVVDVSRIAHLTGVAAADDGNTFHALRRRESGHIGNAVHDLRGHTDAVQTLKTVSSGTSHGKGVTAAQTASATVGTRQELFNFGYLRILIDAEFSGCHIQQYSRYDTDDTKYYDR